MFLNIHRNMNRTLAILYSLDYQFIQNWYPLRIWAPCELSTFWLMKAYSFLNQRSILQNLPIQNYFVYQNPREKRRFVNRSKCKTDRRLTRFYRMQAKCELRWGWGLDVLIIDWTVKRILPHYETRWLPHLRHSIGSFFDLARKVSWEFAEGKLSYRRLIGKHPIFYGSFEMNDRAFFHSWRHFGKLHSRRLAGIGLSPECFHLLIIPPRNRA